MWCSIFLNCTSFLLTFPLLLLLSALLFLRSLFLSLIYHLSNLSLTHTHTHTLSLFSQILPFSTLVANIQATHPDHVRRESADAIAELVPLLSQSHLIPFIEKILLGCVDMLQNSPLATTQGAALRTVGQLAVNCKDKIVRFFAWLVTPMRALIMQSTDPKYAILRADAFLCVCRLCYAVEQDEYLPIFAAMLAQPSLWAMREPEAISTTLRAFAVVAHLVQDQLSQYVQPMIETVQTLLQTKTENVFSLEVFVREAGMLLHHNISRRNEDAVQMAQNSGILLLQTLVEKAPACVTANLLLLVRSIKWLLEEASYESGLQMILAYKLISPLLTLVAAQKHVFVMSFDDCFDQLVLEALPKNMSKYFHELDPMVDQWDGMHACVNVTLQLKGKEFFTSERLNKLVKAIRLGLYRVSLGCMRIYVLVYIYIYICVCVCVCLCVCALLS